MRTIYDLSCRKIVVSELRNIIRAIILWIFLKPKAVLIESFIIVTYIPTKFFLTLSLNDRVSL